MATISLESDRQHAMFVVALETLGKHEDSLSDYDRKFYRGMKDTYEFFGRSAEVTLKQFNYLRSVAWDIETGKY